MPPEAVGMCWTSIGSPVEHFAGTSRRRSKPDPTSIEAENFRGYRAAGVNRVSVGVQALNDADLKALGRQHSADEALAAFRLAAKHSPACPST